MHLIKGYTRKGERKNTSATQDEVTESISNLFTRKKTRASNKKPELEENAGYPY